jgi:thiamine-phosphate pyrophosphorylase
MKLIIITSERILKDEPSLWNKLFERGLTVLHLRKPAASEEDLRRLLLQTDPAFHDRIVLHDRFTLTQSFHLKGVHLNRRNPVPPQNAVSSLSRSCHSIEELEQTGDFNYVFLSPVFDSLSKTAYTHAFSGEELRSAQVRGLINEKVIALGGVHPKTIPLAAEYGFGGVAALGALWGNYSRDKDENALMKRWDELLSVTEKQKQ